MYFYYEFASLFVSMSLCIGFLNDVNVLTPYVCYCLLLYQRRGKTPPYVPTLK